MSNSSNSSGMIPDTVVSPDNYSPLVSIIVLVLLCSSVLAIATRIGMKFAVSRAFGPDDLLIFVALTFGIGQSIAVYFQAANGLGQPIDTLTTVQLIAFQQTYYASQLLYIASLGCAKISVVLLLRQLTPVRIHRTLGLITGVVTAIWTLASLFAAALQCRSSRPWELLDSQCSQQTAFWNFYGVVNIITEVTLIVLPIYTIWDVHISQTRKLAVAACFSARVLVIAPIIAQLVYLNQFSTSMDPTFDLWPEMLCASLVQNMSVITACIPYIKSFFLNLESGMIRADDLRRRGLNTTNRGYGGSKSSTGLSRHKASLGSSNHGTVTAVAESNEMKILPSITVKPFAARNTATIEAADKDANWDTDSQTSQSKIIKQTVEWTVDVDPEPPAGRDSAGPLQA